MFDEPLHRTILEWLKKQHDLNAAATAQAGLAEDLFHQLMVIDAQAGMEV